MTAEIANFALMLALALSLLQASGLVLRATRPYIAASASASALLVFLAFTLLIILRIDSDFTVANVADHSNRALPLLYKIAGAWGNHEGSMLLWALVVTGFGALLARKETVLSQQAASVQACLAAGVLGFILFTSNPFERIFPPPADGAMLNPLLQDMALAMHPPMLYLGYVGFSAVFSLAVSGLLSRTIDSEWGYAAHPWIMGAWSALTLGIALGSWWAYRELGWGGFWFWDPVENASLLPWLAGTALLHSNIVLKKRAHLAAWVALLAILTFGLSLIGTFLVRSGAITSVHSFASDPTRGTYILAYVALAVGGALWLYGTRIGSISTPSAIRPASREGIIVVNNLFLVTACATVLLGTFYPIIAEAISGERVSVGAPYFNATFLPLMAVPLFFAGLAPFIPWKKAARSQLARAWPAAAAAAVTAVLMAATVSRHTLLAACGLSLSAFLMCASAQWMAARHLRNLTHWGVFLGHVGAALVVLGITGVSLWSAQAEKSVGKGDSITLAGYQLEVTDKQTIDDANYTADRLVLKVEKDKAAITTLAPEFRRYKNGSTTSEASIHSTPAYDLYSVAGETAEDGKTALRVYFRPTISFVWMGALAITLGGLFAAFTAIAIKARES